MALGTAVVAIICAAILGVTNRRENQRRDKLYGESSGSATTALTLLSPEAKRHFGQEKMTGEEIVMLGDVSSLEVREISPR